VSKKKYKNALGALYKRKMIVISREKISLAQAHEQADKQTKVQAKEKPKAQPKKSSSIWG
jgi:hypothetical protein